MKKLLLIIIIAAGIASCKKEARIKLPPSEIKLVVTCFITPDDSIISAVVRLSVPKYFVDTVITGVAKEDIKNATVTITNGVKTTNLDFIQDFYFYAATTKDFPITEGTTYTLNVSTPDGKNVSGVTTVPAGRLSVEKCEVVKRRETINALEFDVNTVVTDIRETTNYVSVGVNAQVFTNKRSPFNNTDTSSTGGVTLTFFDTDEKIAKSKYYDTESEFTDFGRDTIRFARAIVQVLNCSKEFYLYNQSVLEASYSNGNPFGNPALVFTNITNGFGCFGAYSGTTIVKRIK